MYPKFAGYLGDKTEYTVRIQAGSRALHITRHSKDVAPRGELAAVMATIVMPGELTSVFVS